jgi:hypothetical protein
MKFFTEFESIFLAAVQHERSDLLDLLGKSEAQLAAWIQHLFQQYLGYSWKEIQHSRGPRTRSKGRKHLFAHLRVGVLDEAAIFIAFNRPCRLDEPIRRDELSATSSRLMSCVRAQMDQANKDPKALIVVTDGDRWHLIGLNKSCQFHNMRNGLSSPTIPAWSRSEFGSWQNRPLHCPILSASRFSHTARSQR